MCGIGGIWGAVAIDDPQRLAEMFSRELAHRGPDGLGVLTIPTDGSARLHTQLEGIGRERAVRAILVHRRLSIIDLSTGDQPMQLRGTPLWIVFNGEIYNYRELRAELALSGARFETQSDTEVILQAYRAWGSKGLTRLNGMFALAIYDGRSDTLLLARDPIGVKPLYWSRRDKTIAFASEMRPLLRGGFARPTPSATGLAQFLFYRFVPAPETILADVKKLMPGHALRFNRRADLVEDIDFARPARIGQANGVELDEELRQAVHRQMVADVQVGAFLSGGLDSSLVVASLGQDACKLPTFAIGFPDAAGTPSELHAAARAAHSMQTDHSALQVSEDDYFDRLPWAVAQVEEPVAHPGMLLQSDLSALARKRVKVVLTGQGADEPLGGYPRHHAARLLGVLGGFLNASPQWVLNGLFPGETTQRLRRAARARSGLDRAVALYSPLSTQEATGLVRGGKSMDADATIRAPLEPWWDRATGLDEVARILYVDVRTSLAEDLLLVGDKMSMAHSLEARVPYLDLDYLAHVEAIPGPQRVRWFGRRKAIQHELGRALLPSSLAMALSDSSSPFRRKRGFDVPVAAWLRRGAGVPATEFLLGRESLSPSLLERSTVNRILAEFMSGRGSAYRQVLALYVLEVWLRNLDGERRSHN